MASVAFREAKIRIANAPLKTPPTLVSSPNSAFKPSAAPAMLPILKKKPPKITRNASKYPLPGKALLAISEARICVKVTTRQMFC